MNIVKVIPVDKTESDRVLELIIKKRHDFIKYTGIEPKRFICSKDVYVLLLMHFEESGYYQNAIDFRCDTFAGMEVILSMTSLQLFIEMIADTNRQTYFKTDGLYEW